MLRRTLVLALAPVLAAAMLVACSDDDDDTDTTSTTVGEASSTTSEPATSEATTSSTAAPTTDTTTPPTSDTTTAPTSEPAAAYSPGDPCPLGSDYDCIDPDGDGQGVYLIGGGDCMASPIGGGLCSDLDGDGYAGYPDSG